MPPATPNINPPNPAPAPVERAHRGPLIVTVLLLLVALAALYGVYTWQHKKVDDSLAKNTSLNTQITNLNKKVTDSQAAKSTSVPAASTSSSSSDLFPGRADVNRTDGRILVEAIWKFSLNPTEVWIDYGESPDNLDKSTVHATKGLGEGTGTYAYGNDLDIPQTSIKAGTHYFYRVSAKVGDKTLNSAVASFIASK